jgi:hypothetical protein
MNRPAHGAWKGARFVSAGLAVFAWVLLSGSDANAQASSHSKALPTVCLTLPCAVHFPAFPRGGEVPLERAGLRISTDLGTVTGRNFRRSPGSFDDTGTAASQRTGVPAFAAAPAGGHRSTSRKVLGGVIGATAGFFAGAYLGAAIEGQGCSCDDPGLQGAMIGAPIGAVVGAILGVKLY